MRHHSRRERGFAAALACLAGYVDALGFLSLGGFFVSFMSGNSTRLGIDVLLYPAAAALACGLIASFVVGVAAGYVCAARRPGREQAAVLILVALALGGAALLSAWAGWRIAAGGTTAFAMGAVNAVYAGQRAVPVGLTYMTGTLVKLGQSLAIALQGGDASEWRSYLVHWLALVLGACAGALAFRNLGFSAIWLACAAAAGLACRAAWRRN